MRKLLGITSFVLMCSVLFAAQLAHAASGVTYQGRILKPDGSALSGSNVQFKLQIRSPNTNSCLMYEELQALDMSKSNGSFSLTMNDGTGTRTDSTGLGLDKVFANRIAFTFDPSTCASGSDYSPSSGDGRMLAVYFKDETMTAWEPVPAQKINYVPFAFEANQISGVPITSLVRVVESTGILDPISPLSNAQYTELLALVGGTSASFSKLGGGSVPASSSLTSGQVLSWNGTSWVGTSVVGGAGSVTSTMLASGAVGSGALASGAVGTSAIANNVSINTSGSLGARDIKLYPAGSGTGFVEMQASPSIADGSSYLLKWPATTGGAGQVLTTDGFGVLSWAAPAVTTQWTSHGANVSYDGGGNVGIGTTSPNAFLEVAGSGQVAMFGSGASTDKTYVGFIDNGSGVARGTIGFDGTNQNMAIQAATTKGIEFNVNSATFGSGTAMVVTPAGAVGIGTTSPSSLLQVASSNSSTTDLRNSSRLILQETTATTGNMATLSFMGAGGSDAAAVGAVIGSHSTGGTVGSLAFYTNNGGGTVAEAMRIDRTGSVGIGTTSPTQKLDVAGTINAQAITINGSPLSASQASQTTASGFAFNSNSDGIGSDGGFTFSANGTALVTIGNTGDTRISSTTASTYYGNGALSVAGGLGVNGGINSYGSVTTTDGTIKSNGSNGIAYTPTSSSLSSPSPVIYNGSLQASNGAQCDGCGTGLNMTSANSLTNSQSAYLATISTNGATRTPSIVIGQQTGATAYSERMRIDPNGNVGIGTTSPATLIDVFGTGGGTNGTIRANDGTQYTALDPSFGLIFNRSASYITNDKLAGSIFIRTSNSTLADTTAVTVLSTGNVGIGSTAPGALLNVGSPATRGVITLTGSTAATPLMQFDNSPAGGKVFSIYNGSAATNTFSIYDQGANAHRLVIDTNGNVGIGTTAPGYTLHSSTSLNTTAENWVLDLQNPNNTAGVTTGLLFTAGDSISSKGGILFKRTGSNGTGDLYILNNATASGSLPTVAADTVTVFKSGGNVGIGTTSPSAKLDVQGGSIRSVSSTGAAQINSSAAVDWSKGNNQAVSVPCTATTFTNMLDGATYNLAVTDTSATQCVFTHAGLTFLFTPANGSRISGQQTLYSFTRIGTYVYTAWAVMN